jgi:hypothetical protein
VPARHWGWIDGIPVTSLARTLVDLAGVVSRERFENAFEEADRLGELDVREVEDVCDRSPGRRGVRRVRALIAARRMPTDTREGLERKFARIIREASLPMPAFNVAIGGYVVDAVWPDHKLIVELDSYAFHDRTIESFE